MKFLRILGLGALSMSLVAGSAFATEKGKAEKQAEKQAEIVKSTQAAMERFYKRKPELKAAVAKAPGYGVFTTYGVSFLIGGSAGTGLVRDNKSKKDVYMNMAGASAGLQISAAQTEMLIVFKSAAAMNRFIESGWEVTNTAAASAGASGATAGARKGETGPQDADTYTLTKNGLEAGLTVGGAKFWKDKDLN